MSNPYTNFNNPAPSEHWPYTLPKQQVFGAMASAALQALGSSGTGLSRLSGTALALTGNEGGIGHRLYVDSALPSATTSAAAATTDLGAHATNRGGSTVDIERFAPGSTRAWFGGTALPYHYAQHAAVYRQTLGEGFNQGNANLEAVLRGVQVNSGLSSTAAADTANVYATLTSQIGDLVSNTSGDIETARIYSLMAQLQVDDPAVLPDPEIDGENGLTSQASNNPGGDTWRAPGYQFNHVIDVTDIDTGPEGNPFVIAAERFNERVTSGNITLPLVDGPGQTPTIAVLLPARTLTARTTVTTAVGTTSSGSVARFDVAGRKVNLHFVGPWSNTATTDLATARTDARDDLNSTYGAVISAGTNGAAGSAQLGFRLANQDIVADIQVWCMAIESAAESAVLAAPDTAVGNDGALGNVQVKLNLCKITDKKPTVSVPPCKHGILVEYTRLDLDGVYVDMVYGNGTAIEYRNPRLGSMTLNNVQVVRSGGSAFSMIGTADAVEQSIPAWGVGQVTLNTWNCPDLWTSRLTTSAGAAILAAGARQDLIVNSCVLREENAAAGRSTDTWATATHTGATVIGSTFAYTSPSLHVVNSLDGETLGTPNASGHYSERILVTNSEFFTEAPYDAAIRIDGGDEVALSDTDMFAGTTTVIAGPDSETAAVQAVYFAPNNLGDLSAAPSQGLLRDVDLSGANTTIPAGSTDLELYGGGDPTQAIAPERINTGSDLSASDDLEFAVFTGGEWAPEAGNPALGAWNPHLYIYNTVYQNKELRIHDLRATRTDKDTRVTELGGASHPDVVRMRTLGTVGQTDFGDLRYLAGLVDWHFTEGPVFIKDGNTGPYIELANPAVIKYKTTNWYYIIDANIPQSGDWDDVNKTGFGPQYIRALGKQTLTQPDSQYSGIYNTTEPALACAVGKFRHSTASDASKFEVQGIADGVVVSGSPGTCMPFEGYSYNVSGLSTPFWFPNWLTLDGLSFVVDPRNGKQRPVYDLKWTNLTDVYADNEQGKHTGFSAAGTHFTSATPTKGTPGFDRWPGTLKWDQIRLSNETINSTGQGDVISKWLHRGSGIDAPVHYTDCDFTDVRREHLVYQNTTDDVLVERCTFQRATAQGIQLMDRSYHYSSPLPDWFEDNMAPGWTPQVTPRTSRDATTPTWTSRTELPFQRIPVWDVLRPYDGIQYKPDNGVVYKRNSIVIDDCHFIDCGYGTNASKIGTTITLQTLGSGQFPSVHEIKNSSIVGAAREIQEADLRVVDVMDVRDPATFGTYTSEPRSWGSGNGWRTSGGIVIAATVNNQQGSNQLVMRHVVSVDMTAQVSDTDKAAYLEANYVGADYALAPGKFDRAAAIMDQADAIKSSVPAAHQNVAEFQYPGPVGDTQTWAQLRSAASGTARDYYTFMDNGYDWWSGDLKTHFSAPSWPQGNEGYQKIVPWRSGANEWLVRDTSTGNMWWYNNDWRQFEEKASGQIEAVNRWVNLGPITGNPKTRVDIEKVLIDCTLSEKTSIINVHAADHTTIKDSSLINRLNDYDAVMNPLTKRRYWRIEIDNGSMSSTDGLNDNRGTRCRRVTLDNVLCRPNNTPTNISDDFLTSTASNWVDYRNAVNSGPDAVGTPSNPNYGNLCGWVELRLYKVDPNPSFPGSGEGVGGRASSQTGGGSTATCDNNPELTLQVSGLDLRGQVVEFVLVPGSGPGSANGPVSQFLTDWATAGYPLPEIATDVTFPDGSNHEYMKYPAVFEPYIDDVDNYPLRNWSWVGLWNGTVYTSGITLFNDLPKYAGWVNPDDY